MDVVHLREEEYKNSLKEVNLKWQDIQDQNVDYVEERE